MANEKTVLLCDNDEALLQQLATELAQAGYDVTTLNEGAQLTQHITRGVMRS